MGATLFNKQPHKSNLLAFVYCHGWNMLLRLQKFENIIFSWFVPWIAYVGQVYDGLVSLFNGISAFMGYLMPKSFL